MRLFVILLDDYHVRRGNSMSVRKPLIDFIQNQLGPADMVALMYPLTPVADIHFSRDRRCLIGAIERFEGRKFDYQPRNQFEEQYAYYPAATVERIRNQVTMGALKAAAVRLGGLREGRKSIIFVSEGFTATLPPQLNDPVAAMPGLGNPARRAPGHGRGQTIARGLLEHGRSQQRHARRVRDRQPAEHVDLRGRSARPRRVRVRHQRGRRARPPIGAA